VNASAGVRQPAATAGVDLGAEAEAWLAADEATVGAVAHVILALDGQITQAELLDALAHVGLRAIRARQHDWPWLDERIGTGP
jgi:hypothetical protein